MKAETLIVCARGAESEIVQRHRPNWQRFFPRIIITSPIDDPLPGAEVFGFSGHHGPEAAERAANAGRLASGFQAACVCEADCLFFGNPSIEPGEFLCSHIHANTDSRFKAPFYYHPPAWSTGLAFAAIASLIPMFDEQGMGDRILGIVLPILGLQVRAVGYSQNSLDTPEFMATAVQAVQLGAACVHGVKTQAMTMALLQADPKIVRQIV